MRDGNCLKCEECLPIGEGDHFCDVVMNLVLEKYQPTVHYGGCVKKRILVKPKKANIRKSELKKVWRVKKYEKAKKKQKCY